jgi:hypothetical protein
MERYSELVHHTLAGADIRFAQVERRNWQAPASPASGMKTRAING